MSARNKATAKTPFPGGAIIEFGDGDAEAYIDLDKLPRNQAAMLREWYRDVIEQSAFIFVEATTESGHFLTVFMGSGHNHQPAALPAAQTSALEKML
jgi:hypothetical protein